MEENNSTTASAPVTEANTAPAETTESETTETDSNATLATEAAKQTLAAKKEEPKKTTRKLKLKVDGQEFEEEFDPNDDAYLTKQLQFAKTGQKRMQEYSELQKDIANFVEELKKNPRKILSDPNIGVDVKQLAAQIIQEEIENSQKSPEQLEKEKLEQRLKELEDERKTEKEEFQKQEFERLQQHAHDQYDIQISQALETSDLPKSPYIVKKMADYMLLGLQNNMDVSPADVLPLVRQEMVSDLKEMFGVMPDEVIEAIVGKDVINRIRKKSVAKAKSAPATPFKSAIKDIGSSSSKDDKAPAKKMTIKDFLGV